MKELLHVLYVEDSLDDFRLVETLLQKGGFDVEMTRVETRVELMEALKDSAYDLVLSDCTLPQFSGFQALEIIHALRPELPFIFVSGTIGEEAAVECLRLGASDYVLKDRLARLVPSICRALNDAKEKMLRQTMERQLRQSRKLEAIGRLAGGIAHDFNNLLQVFRIQIGMISQEADDPIKVRQLCQTLDGATLRGAEMLQELFIFARKTEAHLTSLDLAETIRETAEILQTALAPQIRLNLEIHEPLPEIFADTGKLDRILTNLIMNSKDAMPAGGDITISAQTIRFSPPISNSLLAEDIPYVCLKIRDTGTGMDEFARHHAFEPFFTTKPLGKGTGLGLAVVFGLMQVHHGLIDLQSNPGEGTTVSLYFPVPQTSRIQLENLKTIPPFQMLMGLEEPG